MDDYSSKGSAVHPAKKFHRNFYAIDGAPAASAFATNSSEAGILYYNNVNRNVVNTNVFDELGTLQFQTQTNVQYVSGDQLLAVDQLSKLTTI